MFVFHLLPAARQCGKSHSNPVSTWHCARQVGCDERTCQQRGAGGRQGAIAAVQRQRRPRNPAAYGTEQVRCRRATRQSNSRAGILAAGALQHAVIQVHTHGGTHLRVSGGNYIRAYCRAQSCLQRLIVSICEELTRPQRLRQQLQRRCQCRSQPAAASGCRSRSGQSLTALHLRRA